MILAETVVGKLGMGLVLFKSVSGKILPRTMLIHCTFLYSQEQRSEVEILKTLYFIG